MLCVSSLAFYPRLTDRITKTTAVLYCDGHKPVFTLYTCTEYTVFTEIKGVKANSDNLTLNKYLFMYNASGKNDSW